MRQKWSIIYSCALIAYISSYCHVRAESEMTFRVLNEASNVFDPEAISCEKGYDVPDTPARAYRDAKGNIHLFATNHHNRALIGRSFNELAHPCSIVFKGHQNPDPKAFDDYGWLTSFFTKDGINIFALVHNEYHAFDTDPNCKDRTNCINYSILGANSSDSGHSFTYRNPKLIATLPFTSMTAPQKLSGYSNPTNIIQIKGYYYFFFASLDPSRKKSGVCLMRSSDLENWRAWDGTGFTIQFINPYDEPNKAAQVKACEPVGGGNLLYSLGSVTYTPNNEHYIAVMRHNSWDRSPPGLAPGIYTSTSEDLFHWTPPKVLILDTAVDASGQTELLYPSLIDPSDKDFNFQNTGRDTLLFAVEAKKGKSFDSHKLVYFKLTLQ